MSTLLPQDFVGADRFVEARYDASASLAAPDAAAALLVLASRLSGDETVRIDVGDTAIEATLTAQTSFSELVEVVTASGAPIEASCPITCGQISLTASPLSIRYNALLYSRSRIEVLASQLSLVASARPDRVLAHSLLTEAQKAALPDPTKDLGWCDFEGAIHEIFARNAAAHPDRVCVLETANPLDPATKTRSFSYRQINEASNAVANSLRSQGIENDDVVIIYAYRGVDLVVAVMGVLKAGATFSVIDPAYPPSRQNIYLSVAKPRGLIYLSKAGVINPAVEEYIQENCALKASIAGLELLDSGSLKSTTTSLTDFAAPNVVVGPDSHPTLSFTSGSEGIPKGVRGRHFSLAYYFPWMKETFALSDSDKFTMLSGIAHDPIQRDIFTPLFLGAQLLVPCADDIGTPGRLAEWVQETGATITHLTPAMGQLLSSQASAKMPDLRRAFFVGDILTKRDCFKLQALAQNVDIINMYGTTETQRAVSFFRVPSVAADPVFLHTQKDTIPAGTGMKNVQMLVVNRNDRTQICGVGEVGEIYVRAGGLSDGYLDLPDMTAQKFLTSWFVPEGHWEDKTPDQKYWLGPRDRLYRSGDLGRYLPDGNVECSGRADDQVKIRGFRIELGEINTHISRHPAIRENVTLVRRNKDEEPILVSYVVPETKEEDVFSAHESVDEESEVVQGLVQYRRLVKSLKDYLKTKLPTYAVPSLIVPMVKLPLNPNGKIDKPRLPFPDSAEFAIAAKHVKPENVEWTETEARVRDLWLEILPNPPTQVEPTDSFFDIGGHSILATKMIFQARGRFSMPTLPLGAIFEYPTIKQFASLVSSEEDIIGAPAAKVDATKEGEPEPEYNADAVELAKTLPRYVNRSEPFSETESLTAFVTGVTGFLGSFLVRDLLERDQKIKLVAHVRAKDAAAGLERIKTSGKAYGIWKDTYANRIEVIVGNLEDKHFGLDEDKWTELCESVNLVIHNGALVHWVYPYSILRGPNVTATINVMELCTIGAAKTFTFVSSTSVLDNDHYVELSDKLLAQGKAGIPESDSLDGSATGLGNGYGQSKWVGEYLVRYAGEHCGLSGTIVRPGYILGDRKTGISNTDDFLIRMIKGSQELGLYPDISNTVNMVPVDHVARVTAACALNPVSRDVAVAQVTSHPRITFSEMLSSLESYGYNVRACDYMKWRVALEQYVVEKGDHALFPLLHFVLDNLPQSTKAPELDDTNTVAALVADAKRTGEDVSAGSGVDEKQIGVYLAFLSAIDFLEAPESNKLPELDIPADLLQNFTQAGGRSK